MKHFHLSKAIFLLTLFLSSALGIQAQTTFNYTGTIVNYTVPAGTTSLVITARGAQGGASSYFSGGQGASMSGSFAVTPGQVLKILVGQQPASGSNAGGGGGGSFVWDDATGTLLIAAGGGGGGGFSGSQAGLNAVITNDGTNGGTLSSGGGVSGNGGTQPTGQSSWACGGAGWLTNGNAGSISGSCTCSGGTRALLGGTAGTFVGGSSVGNGGFGGGGAANARCGIVGGGGGGGYSGGGAGADGPAPYVAGGGGGSFNSGTLQTNSVGNTGNGQVVIAPPPCSNPPASTGATSLCIGAVSTLSNGVSGGVWSSSNASVASVNAGTGAVTGVLVGTANITYSVSGGCSSFVTLTVTATPSISNITSNAPLCAGNTLTMTANTPLNVSAYSWAGPGAITGASMAVASVAGVTTASSGAYSLTVSNGTGVGCSVTYTTPVSILASPASTLGTAQICQTFTTLLTNSVSGGTWTSTSGSVASVSASGLVTGLTAGTTTISYTLSSGCAATRVVTVNALPVLTISPSSSATVCLSNSASFSAIAPGATFNWVGVSGATGLSCTSCAAPAITPAATGASVYSVTATSGAGCTTTSGVTITVNELPSDISGSSNVCVGTATTLTSSAGGDWTSSNVGVAAIGISSGVVTGLSTGAVTISYTLPTGCRKTAVMNVLATPAPIGGTAAVCSGLTTNLTHPVSGGTWSSSDAVVASVNPSGVVTGGNAGNATISYTLPSGCIVTALATVNTLPAAIVGSRRLCVSRQQPL
jgi:trimeric autotransporter adhesin